MKLLQLYGRFSWKGALMAVLVGSIAGLSSATLMALISNRVADSRGPTLGTAVQFAGLALVDLLATFAAAMLSIQLSQKTTLSLRLHLCRRILDAPLRRLEEAGSHRIIAALTDDIPTIAGAFLGIPNFFISLAIVVGCLSYLAWLSPKVFPVLIGLIAVSVISYLLVRRKANPIRRQAREEWDTLMGHFRSMTEGAKELKLHRRRRESFFAETLQTSATALQRLNLRNQRVFAVVNSWQQILYFFIIGLILFALPSVTGGIDNRIMTGYALTVLYIRGPLMAVISIIPSFMNANIALQKIDDLGISLSTPEPARDARPSDAPARWESLELVGVTHKYRRQEEDGEFTLGPLDLTFRPGELVFIVGGNGSGKTTLAKLITGLYPPESGEIRLGGVAVTDANRDEYRQNFSAVFTDFFLFEKMLGLVDDGVDERAQGHIARLRLQTKVKISGGRLSTTELSYGQRKRLALLTAYLEDRPIYVFDEWAAGQDPVFKEVFYRELLPDLKAAGKTVLVINHDDSYFDAADRIVKLEDGRLDFDSGPPGFALTEAAAGGHAHAPHFDGRPA